jgi:CRP/FNR family cyclic AMP-dependent transcriptional regulator
MLSETLLFSELSTDDIALLTEYGSSRRYPKNSILIHKGDESTGVYLINSGRVKVYIGDDMGGEIIFRYQQTGEFFGEMALIDTRPRTASVATVEDTRVVYINSSNFDRCMTENPEFSTKLLRYFIQRISDLSDDLADCALKSVYQRVRDKLPALGVEKDGILVLDQPYTHKDIAGLIGSGREMVSRIMKKLEKGGYLDKRDGRMVILKDLPRNLPG